jgi:hypothetical protein
MLVYIRPLGGNLAYVHPLDADVDPGFGRPGGGVDPGYGIETHPHPDHGLPGGGGHPGNALPPSWAGYPTTGPVFPGKPVDPGFGIPPGAVWWPVDPGFGRPVRPPHVGGGPVPPGPPPTVKPGETLVLVRDASGAWHYAALPPGGTTKPIEPPPAQPKA